MHRRRQSLFALLAALGAATTGTGAAEPASGLDAYLEAVARAEAGLNDACANTSPPPDGRVWLRLGAKGIEIVPADPSGAEAAAFWASAALGAQDAARALYGQAAENGPPGGPVLIEATGGTISVHDGREMIQGDYCAALRSLTGALGGAGAAPFAAARQAATSPTLLTLAIGSGARAPLSTPPPPGAVAIGPDGVEARIEAHEGGADISLTAHADARPGDALIHLYDPNNPFSPLDTLPIRLLPGPAAAPAAPTGTLTPGEALSGTLPLGASATITVTVKTPGRVTFSSGESIADAPSDIAAELETESGEPIGGDDDSGPGYGFSFAAELQPGTYRLRLSHCCGGGGNFSVNTRVE